MDVPTRTADLGRRLAELQARSIVTDREVVEALVNLRKATEVAVAAADRLLAAIAAAPAPDIRD